MNNVPSSTEQNDNISIVQNEDMTSIKNETSKEPNANNAIKQIIVDVIVSILAGCIISLAFHFFQNSNGFAPGGVGGLATITYHLTGYKIPWGVFMLAFNLPILILVSIFVNKRLGVMLMIYIATQSLGTFLLETLNIKAYTLNNCGDDFNLIFACIATGVISGVGFSLAIRRLGAGGGTYAIASLIKKIRPATNIAYVSFLLDGFVVIISFFVYGMKVTPVMCTFLNLFIANIVVDQVLAGIKNGYRFEIVTTRPEEIAQEIIEKLGHGVTEINGIGMYSHSEKAVLMCVVRKRQLGKFMKIIQKYPDTFASFSKVNEVFGRFHK